MKFIPYQIPGKNINTPWGDIASFLTGDEQNLDKSTVESFGSEWSKFDFFSEQEIQHVGDTYFDIVTDKHLQKETTRALDVGCGSGRWSYYLADKVHTLDCIDPSDAVFVAKKNLSKFKNTRVAKTSVEAMPFPNGSFDFVFSLGVLHHIPDTQAAMKNCVNKLKKGGFFLIYLYYNLDNRGWMFKLMLKIVTMARLTISKLPEKIKHIVCDLLAITIYMPFISLARLIKLVSKRSTAHQKIPLSYYIDKSFNVIRNDALDRFGTPLEQRFSKKEIKKMLEEAGIYNITFSKSEPYWHAIGEKK
ncbi:MAG: class I SAM-dependent methyltransferase [Ekhidna sp.]